MTENLTTIKMLGSSTLLPAVAKVTEQHINSTLSSLLQSMNSTETLLTTTTNSTEEAPTDAEIVPDNSGHFILVPFVVLLLIVALSALVFLIGRNRRRLARVYCRRRSERKYSFDEDSDSPLEQGDDYDFDDPSECLLKGKLQIDNNYDSTQRKELYT